MGSYDHNFLLKFSFRSSREGVARNFRLDLVNLKQIDLVHLFSIVVFRSFSCSYLLHLYINLKLVHLGVLML